MSGTRTEENIARDREKYLDAWAETMITIWKDRIRSLNIGDTHDLYTSFSRELLRQSGGDVAKIRHGFNYYGSFVDMGVGSGVRLEDAGHDWKRRPKPWFNKKYYASVMSLREMMAELYGEEFTRICITWLQS